MLGTGTLGHSTLGAGPDQSFGRISAKATALAVGAGSLSVGTVASAVTALGKPGSRGTVNPALALQGIGALAGIGTVLAHLVALANSTAPESPIGAPPTFPTLPGIGWSVHKKPNFSTRVAKHVSGRQVRAALYAWPLWQFELTFDALSSNYSYSGIGNETLQVLMGFYLLCEGQWGTFLYIDPSDHLAITQPIGIGDGSTTGFPCYRQLGGFTELVSWVTEVTAVYLNGVKISTVLYNVSAPNQINFITAPSPGVAITTDFAFAYVCHFTDDQEDFEEFMSGLWTVQSLKFESVKP